jgi:hypothetical protein
MMTKLRMAAMISFILLLLGVVSNSYAGEDLWEFDDDKALKGWRVESAAYEIKGGSFTIKEGSFPVIYSPGRLNIESSQSVFSLRIKTNKPGVVNLSLYSAHTNFTYTRSFNIQATKDFHDYRVYLGDYIPGGDIFYDFAFKLPGNKLDASIDSISFHSPGRWELAGIFWDNFWGPKRAMSASGVNAPMFGSLSMVTLLYFFVPLVTILLVLAGALRSGRLTRALFFKSLLIGFALSAFIFTFRMDFNFLHMWRIDRATLAGKSEPERLRAIHNGNYDSYFDIIDQMRALIPAGEKIRPANRVVNAYNDQIARNVAYHMLPVRSSPRANYLWLYFDDVDKVVTYDAERLVLKSGDDVIASDVRPVKLFGNEAALYELGPGIGGRGRR